MKVYISGPMTGKPDLNFPEFMATEDKLQEQGWIVINPARMPQGLSYAEYMKLDLFLLGMCEAIYLLEGWQHSKGARAELSFAISLGLTILGDNVNLSEIDAFQQVLQPAA